MHRSEENNMAGNEIAVPPLSFRFELDKLRYGQVVQTELRRYK